MENLDLPATPTETTQVNQNPPTLSQTKVLKKESKFLKPLLYILASLGLLSLGAFGFWFYQKKTSQKEAPFSLSEITPSPELSPFPTQTKKSIEWVTYEDEKIDYLKFKYPKGGVVRKLEDEKGTYTLEMVYKDLKLEVSTPPIGGGEASINLFTPYTIVYGNYYGGIGKRKSYSTVYPNEIEISYFHFCNGGFEFGGFLIGNSKFTFRIPDKLLSDYEWIADIIACSTRDLEPDKQPKISKAYLTYKWNYGEQERIVMGLKDGKYHPVTLGPQGENERVYHIVTNFDGSFFLIVTMNKPRRFSPPFIYIFDVANSSLVTVDNNQKLLGGVGWAPWLNNSEFIYTCAPEGAPSKFYKVNVKDRTRIEITKEQFDQYGKESQKRSAASCPSFY